MTEHKMTAKEKFRKWLKTNWGIQTASAYEDSEIEEIAIEYAKQFALQVATEAVEEEIGFYEYPEDKREAKWHGEQILKNIKKRLNDAD